MRSGRTVTVAAVLAAGWMLAGCADDEDPGTAAPLSTGAGEQTFTPAVTSTPTPTATATSSGEVPETCGELVPISEVLTVVGVPLEGEGTFVYAGPLPDAGRTGRITCGYGVRPGPNGEDLPSLELTVNGYVDAATARGRLDATVESARGRGQSVQAAELDGRAGFVIADAEASSYVLADGDRTVVVSLRRGVVPASAEQLVLTDVAALVLGLPVVGPEQ